MLGYLSLDIICSSKLTFFLELRSRKTVRFSEQIMSADKYPSIFSRQMETIVYIFPTYQLSKQFLARRYRYGWNIPSFLPSILSSIPVNFLSTSADQYLNRWRSQVGKDLFLRQCFLFVDQICTVDSVRFLA